MDGIKYLNTEQAAVHLNMQPKTLARYRVTGEGPVYHVFGRLIRYVREDLDKWAKERRRGSTSDNGAAPPDPDASGSPASGARGRAGSGDPGMGAAQ